MLLYGKETFVQVNRILLHPDPLSVIYHIKCSVSLQRYDMGICTDSFHSTLMFLPH